MQDRTIKSSDRHGFITLQGVYDEARVSINEDLSLIPVGITKVKKINYRLFGDIVRLYLKIMFRELLLGKSFKLLNKFGKLSVVKTLCIRYNPVTHRVYTDENGDKVVKKLKFDVDKYGGYWHFIFWDVGKKWRQYKFSPAGRWKKAYMEKVDEGMEYLDMSLLNYGQSGAVTYIRKVK